MWRQSNRTHNLAQLGGVQISVHRCQFCRLPPLAYPQQAAVHVGQAGGFPVAPKSQLISSGGSAGRIDSMHDTSQ